MFFRKYIPSQIGDFFRNRFNSDILYLDIRKYFPETLLELIWKKEYLCKFIRKWKASKIMEIGTAGGSNAKIMIEVAKENRPADEIYYFGFDIFGKPLPEREPEDKTGGKSLKSVRRDLESTGANIFLTEGDTNDTLPRIVDKLPSMDIIFIEGGHSFQTCFNDWRHSKNLMNENANVFFDDYSRPGPRKVIECIRTESDVEIKGIKNDMVRVKQTQQEGLKSN